MQSLSPIFPLWSSCQMMKEARRTAKLLLQGELSISLSASVSLWPDSGVLLFHLYHLSLTVWLSGWSTVSRRWCHSRSIATLRSLWRRQQVMDQGKVYQQGHSWIKFSKALSLSMYSFLVYCFLILALSLCSDIPSSWDLQNGRELYELTVRETFSDITCLMPVYL